MKPIDPSATTTWCLWMAKANCLAPGWGITITKKEMLARLRQESPTPDHWKVVRVLVQEVPRP